MHKAVDITGWKLKSRRVRTELYRVLPAVLEQSTDEVFRATIKNLTGPHYKAGERGPQTGKMPVPRITGTLARSMKRKKIGLFVNAVYSDERVANYNKYVHDGTRKMRPRRFLGDVVRERRPAIFNRMKYQIKLALQRVGR